MKLILETTDTHIELDGVGCRLCCAITEGGIPCFVFVYRLAYDINAFPEEPPEFAALGHPKPQPGNIDQVNQAIIAELAKRGAN